MLKVETDPAQRRLIEKLLIEEEWPSVARSDKSDLG
jgi:hypothetical protein